MKRSVLPLAVLGLIVAAPPMAAAQQAVTAEGGIGLQQAQLAPVQDVLMAVEQRLQQLGYDVTPDGQFDANTRNNVLQFQSENGLRPTGNVDLSTIAALGIDVSPGAGSVAMAPATGTEVVVVEEETAMVDDNWDYPLLRSEFMSAPQVKGQSGPLETDPGIPLPPQVSALPDIPGIQPDFSVENLY